MALLLNGNAVFLHIPKTGGNWVTKVLTESGLVRGSLGHKRIGFKHADMDRVLAAITGGSMRGLGRFAKRCLGRHTATKPFMFCFVRHPISWYESWFKYMSQSDRQWRDWGDPRNVTVWHPNSILNGLGDRDFNRFVRNVVEARPGYVTELYGWYAKPQIDFVGKQENLREDLIRVLQILGLDFDEDYIRSHPALGVSRKTSSRLNWDPGLRREVCRLEYASLVRFGYSENEVVTCGAPRLAVAAV